ncbi:MAG: DUF2924 domain-containing protein [Pseudomonadota bacterium]
MSGSEVSQLIEQVEQMKLEDIRAVWHKRYGNPPRLQSLPIMRMMLAWRIQADELGGLDKQTKRALTNSGSPQAEGKHLGNGARLTRIWKGREVEVVVEEGGFRWEGNVYASLSAAATAIAGSRWNGPRFFGLRDQTGDRA